MQWLSQEHNFSGCSFITSLPDVSELPAYSLEQWKEWFSSAAELVCQRCPEEGVAIFFQSDIKKNGAWVDKGYLVTRAAETSGCTLLWHKIVCRVTAGATTYGRAGYSHMLCFSKRLRQDLSRSTADVLPDAGKSPWTRGMGVTACAVACRYVLSQTPSRIIVDPFCGRGTVLAVANALGLDAVGVELSRKRARQSQSLKVQLP